MLHFYSNKQINKCNWKWCPLVVGEVLQDMFLKLICFTHTPHHPLNFLFIYLAISASEEAASAQPGHFLDLLASSQGRRLDEQRASMGTLPGLLLDQNNSQAVLSQLIASADSKEPDDDFFDILIKCQVGHSNQNTHSSSVYSSRRG